MAPSRKTGSAIKQSPTKNSAITKKDEEDVKTMQKRKRLGDILGPQWSDTELQQFYEAYRLFGMNWKKVAAAVRSRSVEMVEALYSMNRAYLSLPEGTASVAGLIAMVSDHYCVMEKTDSEQEVNEDRSREIPKRAKKRKRRKYSNSSFKDIGHNLSDRSTAQFVGSTSDCLSLLKANLPVGDARVVGKRTPRVPVAHSSANDFGGKYLSGMSNKNFKMDADDHVAHEIALALTKSSLKDKTSQVTPLSIASQRKIRNKPLNQGMTNAQLCDSVIDDQDHNRKTGSIRIDVDNLRRGGSVRERERVGAVDTRTRGKGFYGKKTITENECDAFEALNKLADLSITLQDNGIDIDNWDAYINTFNAKWKGSISFRGDDDLISKCDSSNKGRKSSPYCKEGEHVHKTTLLVSRDSEGDFPSKTRNWRKRDLPRLLNHKHTNSCLQVESGRSGDGDGKLSLKAKLANCLSWRKAQRWCAFEWFYSAIDYPWFARREFVEYLDYVGLGHIPTLTRVEWGVIRSSLGKPRRFSKQFLKEEKEKLNKYRESVRKHYTELRLGSREGLPTDLARPLSVGQRVIAVHPKTREIHDGSVLTVDCSRCRVQFDEPELGVEFIMDIDCMPLNTLENMPSSLAINQVSENHRGVTPNRLDRQNAGRSIDAIDGPSLRLLSESLAGNLTKHDVISSTNTQPTVTSNGNEQQAVTDQPSFPAQEKENVVKALYEMTCALDKKEVVVSEFKRMNDEVEENKRKDGSFEVSEHFNKRYASVLVQLDDFNNQVDSALNSMRKRNTYQESNGITSMKPALGDIGSLSSTLNKSTFDISSQETIVTEILDGSRSTARKMVNVAMQAMSSLRNTNSCGVEEAIDFLNSQLSQEKFCIDDIRSFPVSSTLDKQTAHASVAEKCNNIHVPESNVQIPSELITNCVATLFMIQKCTEREFPPADVAKILDSAVTSLQPCSSQNVQIYTEIQKCMGIIRSQILALIRV